MHVRSPAFRSFRSSSFRRRRGRSGALAWLAAAALSLPGTVAAATLKVCVDQADWHPFVFQRDGAIAGIHVDLIERAATTLGHRVEFQASPWVRCLLDAEGGTVDAVATAVYSAERARYLRYPADAPYADRSQWAVAQIDDVIVTLTAAGYRYTGDPATLPQPVRAPRGWAVVDFLQRHGVEVDAGAATDADNLTKLLRDGNGSVVAISESVQVALRRPEFDGRFDVSPQPLRTQSYFLPVARASRLSDAAVQAIWDELARLRADQAVMAELRARY
jgi:polar amino acid transport system substrate-binding protein